MISFWEKIVVKSQYQQIILLTLICTLSACGGSSSSSDSPVPGSSNPISFAPVSSQIPRATTNEVGFDNTKIADTYRIASQDPDIFSFLVLKNDRLVAEAYFNGSNQNSLRHVRSTTKTVLAVLTGIALDQGLFISTDQTIGEFIGDDYPSLTEDKRAITIEHLLTMTSGFNWNEASYITWETSDDPVDYLLSRLLEETPGEVFHYNSAAVHLLSVVLEKIIQGSVANFAREHLFTPLNISDYRWDRLKDGRVNGGAGLQLKPIDTAKVGLMLINNGIYNDTQIVSEEWLIESTKRKAEFTDNPSFGPMIFNGYGYLWWQGTGANTGIDLAWGWGGQFIATIPEHDIVIITNSRHNVFNEQADRQEINNLSLIIDGILPALN